MTGSHGDRGRSAVQMCSQGKSARSEKQLFSFFPVRALGRQHHKYRALSTQGLPVRKPKVCAELADLEKGISQSAKETKPLFQHTSARRSPGCAQYLAQVPG